MIDLLLQYGLFLAKVVTVVVAALFIIVTIANVGERRRHHDEDGDIEVMRLNERLETTPFWKGVAFKINRL